MFKGVIRTILLLMPILCASPPAAADPAQPAPKTDPFWAKLHDGYVDAARTRGGDVVFSWRFHHAVLAAERTSIMG